MERYRRYIQRLREEKSKAVFMNSSTEHAIIVLSELFQSAEKEVLILSRNLSREVTDNENYLKQLDAFLQKKNTKLEIILTNYSEHFKHSRIYEVLTTRSKENPNIMLFKSNSQATVNEEPVNFVICDSTAYRFEYNLDDREAIGSFNGGAEVESLKKIFNKLKDGAESIPL